VPFWFFTPLLFLKSPPPQIDRSSLCSDSLFVLGSHVRVVRLSRVNRFVCFLFLPTLLTLFPSKMDTSPLSPPQETPPSSSSAVYQGSFIFPESFFRFPPPHLNCRTYTVAPSFHFGPSWHHETFSSSSPFSSLFQILSNDAPPGRTLMVDLVDNDLSVPATAHVLPIFFRSSVFFPYFLYSTHIPHQRGAIYPLPSTKQVKAMFSPPHRVFFFLFPSTFFLSLPIA